MCREVVRADVAEWPAHPRRRHLPAAPLPAGCGALRGVRVPVLRREEVDPVIGLRTLLAMPARLDDGTYLNHSVAPFSWRNTINFYCLNGKDGSVAR